jgi:D-alanyl-D-alanine dipeptidase
VFGIIIIKFKDFIVKTLTILSLTIAIFTACQSTPKKELIVEQKKAEIIIPKSSKQLLIVTTLGWESKDGELQRYEKRDDSWQKVGKLVPIVVGKNGMGWGIGLHKIPKDAKYIKKEGDGKAPAGLFELGNAFGYNSFTLNFPYSIYTRADHCVDDSKSRWYNQIINSKEVEKDYSSFEYMKLKNNLYRYGIIVNHNPNQVPNAGSCIFIHIQSPSGKGTAGCTAMRESEILKILKWLKEENRPLLLQLPKKEINVRVANINF